MPTYPYLPGDYDVDLAEVNTVYLSYDTATNNEHFDLGVVWGRTGAPGPLNASQLADALDEAAKHYRQRALAEQMAEEVGGHVVTAPPARAERVRVGEVQVETPLPRLQILTLPDHPDGRPRFALVLSGTNTVISAKDRPTLLDDFAKACGAESILISAVPLDVF